MKKFKVLYLITLIFLCVDLTPIDIYGQMPSRLDTVYQTITTPYNEVCFLRIRRKRIIGSSYFISTGFLIKPNVVLTAAHNIHSSFNSIVASIEIVLGKYFDKRPEPTVRVPRTNLQFLPQVL
jgi:hypothetical protein